MADAIVSNEKVDVPIWDLPTRVFHWLLVASVLVAWITAELPGPGFAIHKLAGYSIGGALIFRVIWGFIGSPHSRFADFIKPWSDIEAHARMLFRMSPPRSVGHNPIGGWMICALMIVLTTIVVSGLFSASEDLAGPFAEAIPSGLTHLIADLHEAAFNILLVLVTIHVLGVCVDMVLNRENLIGAMWWGRKSLGADAARFERPFAPLWWAVAAAAIGIIVMAWIAL